MIVETTVGVALAGLLFRVRQARVKRRFVKQFGPWIEQENQALAEAWRCSNPLQQHLLVERSFKPGGFMAPTITVRQRFRRDERKGAVK